MFTRLIQVALVAVVLSASVTGLTARGQSDPSPSCVPSTEQPGQATPTADPIFTSELPAGVAQTVLASGLAEKLPAAPVRLQLTRLEFEPGSGADTRQAVAAILFFVLEGRVTIYIGGQARMLDQGASAVVQVGDLYAMINDGGTPARLLRLAIAPRDAVDEPVAIVVTPPPLLLTPVTPPTSTLLFRAEVADSPQTSSLLFLTCLRWQETEGDTGDYRHSGPVGLRVLSGSLLVDGERTIPETGCTFLVTGATHRLQGAVSAPTVLIFGAIPEGQNLWLPTENPTTSEAGSNPSGLTCGEA